MTGSDETPEDVDEELYAILKPRLQWVYDGLIFNGVNPYVVDDDELLTDQLNYLVIVDFRDFGSDQFMQHWAGFVYGCQARQARINGDTLQ